MEFADIISSNMKPIRDYLVTQAIHSQPNYLRLTLVDPTHRSLHKLELFFAGNTGITQAFVLSSVELTISFSIPDLPFLQIRARIIDRLKEIRTKYLNLTVLKLQTHFDHHILYCVFRQRFSNRITQNLYRFRPHALVHFTTVQLFDACIKPTSAAHPGARLNIEIQMRFLLNKPHLWIK